MALYIEFGWAQSDRWAFCIVIFYWVIALFFLLQLIRVWRIITLLPDSRISGNWNSIFCFESSASTIVFVSLWKCNPIKIFPVEYKKYNGCFETASHGVEVVDQPGYNLSYNGCFEMTSHGMEVIDQPGYNPSYI